MGTGAGLAATYSLGGHMVEVTPPGGAAIAMKYTDATQDRRILARAQRMGYNQLGLSTQAPTNASSSATWFVRDPDRRLVGMLTSDPGTSDLYYLFDGLGSVVATTDGAGNLVKRYAYEPYGDEINPSSGDGNPWRYAAGYYDTATGMLKYGTRYYMPSVARWTQRDPVMGNPQQPSTLSRYGYVGGDPVNHVDPTGRACGPGGGVGDDLVPDGGAWYDFTSSCVAHDQCYAAGGGAFDKVGCDLEFLANNWNSCGPRTGLSDAACRGTAIIYYAAVDEAGVFAFNWEEVF